MAEVKIEYQNFCRCCLSVNRNMKPIGNYADIFCRIMQHNPAIMSTLHITDSLCWECYALLTKVVHFQKRVENAHAIMELADTQYVKCNLTSLSSITTKVWTDENDENYFCYDHNKLEEDSKIYLSIKNEAVDVAEPTDIKYEEFSDGGFDSSPLRMAEYEDYSDDYKPIVKPETLQMLQVSTQKLTKKCKSEKVEDNMMNSFRKITMKKFDRKDESLYTRVSIKDNAELSEWIDEAKRHDRYQQAMFKCALCVTSFNSMDAMKQHNDIHHHRDSSCILCNICSRSFKSKHALARHADGHMVKYKCNLCGYLAFKRNLLYLHVKTCHTRIFECTKCGSKCWTRKEFFSHYKNMHRKFICDYCGKTLKERCRIINHIRKKHSDNNCDVCKKKFKTYRIMNEHRKMYHEVRPSDDAYCVECNMRFNNALLFKRHLASSVKHNPPKKESFPCPVCQKVYSKKCTMNYHFKYVHKQESSFKCNQCNRSFLNGFRLRQHKQSIHEKVERPRNKICTMCGRGFSTNRILTNHIRTHTGERPHACQYCSATFAQKTAMTVHVRNIHTNKEKKPFAF